MQEKEIIASVTYNSPQEAIKNGRGEFPTLPWPGPGDRACLSEFLGVGADSWFLLQLCDVKEKPD